MRGVYHRAARGRTRWLIAPYGLYRFQARGKSGRAHSSRHHALARLEASGGGGHTAGAPVPATAIGVGFEFLGDVAGELDRGLALAYRRQIHVDEEFRQARQAAVALDRLQVMRDRGAQEWRDRQVRLDRGEQRLHAADLADRPPVATSAAQRLQDDPPELALLVPEPDRQWIAPLRGAVAGAGPDQIVLQQRLAAGTPALLGRQGGIDTAPPQPLEERRRRGAFQRPP